MRPQGTHLLDSRSLRRCSQAPYPYAAYDLENPSSIAEPPLPAEGSAVGAERRIFGPYRYGPTAFYDVFSLQEGRVNAPMAGTFVLVENSELFFLMHKVNPLPVIYWNATAYSYYGDVPNEDRLEAAMRLLLTVEPDAFAWTLRAPMPRRLHEAFAFHSVGSGRNGYQITLMVRKPAPAHP
jgi:hypothetical protein